MQKITVNWNALLQPLDGFGVCGAFMQARNLQGYPEEDRKIILDALFSRQAGAGISMVRNIVGDSGVWGNLEDGPTASIMPQKGVYGDTGDEDQLWFMREAAQRGCGRIISSVWSPPAWMKTTGTVVNGGELKTECYADFAAYLAEYIRIYKERHGIDIYAISPSNEPDYTATYSSCLWSGEQFAFFYKHHLEPEFAKRGITAPTFGPEVMHFGNSSLRKYAAMFAGDVQMPDIVAMHGYEDSVIEPLDRDLIGERKVWMSEFCEIDHPMGTGCDPSLADGLRVARNLHRYLTIANCNAYIYFWGMSKYDNNSALIRLDRENKRYTLCKRLYTFGQFSRFLQPGSVRLAATHDCGEELLASAYRNASGQLVVVAINMGASAIACRLDCAGLATQRLTPYYTDQTRNLQCGEAIPSGADGAFTLALPAESVTTFTAERTKEN
jgi:glucuronoarabinoxylan endo-1,4-beta-xylanase